MARNSGVRSLFLILGLVVCIGLGVLICTFDLSLKELPCKQMGNTAYTTAQEQYIQHTQESLQQLLEPLVGYGKVKVTVTASFNYKINGSLPIKLYRIRLLSLKKL